MPIYDMDGTTNYEIGKLYDNDGTTSHQIGKVYDYDGTASNLIYNSILELYEAGTFKTPMSLVTTGNGKISNNGSEYIAFTTSNSTAWSGTTADMVTTEKVDLSGINKIYADVSCWHAWGGAGAEIWVGNDRSKWTNRVAIKEYANTTGRTTIELDVSNLNGSYYIGFGAFTWIDASGSASTESAFYKVWGE